MMSVTVQQEVQSDQHRERVFAGLLQGPQVALQRGVDPGALVPRWHRLQQGPGPPLTSCLRFLILASKALDEMMC